MVYDILNKKNITFGVIWGTLAYFVGQYIVKIVTFIQNVLGFLFNLGLNGFTFPNKILDFVNLNNTLLKAGLVILIAILLSPFARRAYEWFIKISKKSSVWEKQR